LLTSILAIGAIVNAAIIPTGKAKMKELKYLSINPFSTPVLTAVITPLIIKLIPKAIIIINMGGENFFEIIIKNFLIS